MSRWALGLAHAVREEREAGRAVLEEGLAIARDSRAALFTQPNLLSHLILMYLEIGEVERAKELIEELRAILDQVCDRLDEPFFHLARARFLLRSEGEGARREIESELEKADSVAREIGSRVYLPRVHEERAGLAALLGDEEGRRRELREALRLFEAIHATGHVDRLKAELGM